MIVTPLLLGHLACVQLAESVLEIGEGAFGLADLDIVPAEDIGVAGGLADELGGLEELALGLDALVDVLDLLVQFVRLGEDMWVGSAGGGEARGSPWGMRVGARGGGDESGAGDGREEEGNSRGRRCVRYAARGCALGREPRRCEQCDREVGL